METKDFIIYNGIANAARRLFEHVICNAGEFGAADIAKKIFNRVYFEDNFYNSDEYNEIITVEFDGYKCTFPFCDAFSICAQIETAWQIPSARRVRFIRAQETAAPVVCFDVPAAAKDIIKCIPAKFDNLRPVLNYVCVDTRRRALITGAGQILNAVAVQNMYVSQDAKETYLIDPSLLKTGKGQIIIDANGNAANGTKAGARVDETAAARNFPSWENVFPAVADSQKIELNGDVWKQLKKEFAAAAKYSDNADKITQISGRAQDAKIFVTYIRLFETAGKETARDVAINLPQPCPFDFSVRLNGKLFASAPAADSLYIYRNMKNNVSVCTSAAGAVSYFVNLDDAKDAQINAAAVPAVDETTNDAPALLTRAAFPELNAANTPAAVAAFDAINAPAADSAKETRPSWANNLPAAVVKLGDVVIFGAPQDEETAAPVPEETPAADSVPAVDQTTNDAPAVAVSEATDAPAVAVADSVPAVDEETPQTCANVETAAPQDETTPAAVPEAAAAPVCLPVPVSAVYPLHAVYIDKVLHGVYFSKLLADDIFWNAFFAGRAVYDLEILSNETAPAVKTGAIIKRMKQNGATDEEINSYKKDLAVAVAAGRLTAADVPAEISAAVSVFACVPEIPETAAAVPEETAAAVAVDETTNDAPAVCVSLPQDEETAAPAFDYQTRPSWERPSRARRFRLRRARFAPWLIRAAAVAALIVCAAVANWERPAPVAAADSVPAVAVADSLTAFASAFVDETANSAPQDETTNDAPAVAVSEATDAPAVAVADSVPAAATKRPRRARKQPQPAPVAVADSLTAFASAFVADSVPAVAVAVAAPQDEETAAPVADSVPAVDETTPQDETAPDAPAVAVDETDDDGNAPAPAVPADSVPASNGNAPAAPAAAPGTPAPAVPAVFGTITAAPVWIITL